MLQLSPVYYYDNYFRHHASWQQTAPLAASWQHTVPLASAVVIVADTSNGKSAGIKAYNYYGLRYHMRAPAAKGVHVTATQMAMLSFEVTSPLPY